MDVEAITNWGGLISMIGAGVCFLACMLVVILQPDNRLRAGFIGFSGLTGCVGTMLLLGAWRHIHIHGFEAGQVLLGAGIAAWLFAIGFLAGGLTQPAAGASSALRAPAADSELESCTRHARWLSFLNFVGVVLGIAGYFAQLRWGGGSFSPLRMIICTLGPGLLFPALFLFTCSPRCQQCRAGKLRLMLRQKATYCCGACGHQIQTSIHLGGKHR